MAPYEDLKRVMTPIIQTIGGDVEREFNELLAVATAARESRSMLDRAFGQPAAAAPPAQTASPAASASVNPPKRGRGRPRKHPVTDDNGIDTAEKLKVEIQFDLLRAEAEGPEALTAEFAEAYKRLKLTGRKYTDKSRHRRVTSMHAWTHGKFVGKYVQRFLKVFGEDRLPELAATYTKIQGSAVTVQDLKRKAEQEK